MIQRRVIAVVLMAMVWMAVFSGGTTNVLLSDTETVTASMTVDPTGNGTSLEPQVVGTNTTTDGTTDSSTTVDGGGIAVALEPEGRTIDSDNETDRPYDVATTTGSHLTVTATSDPPTATDDSFSTTENESVAMALLANDTDPDGDPLTVEDTGTPSNGTVIEENGSYVYQPDPGFTGEDTFTYRVSDSEGQSDTATVSIAVGKGN